ncbi:Hsp70 family protein [uncultured Desulfobacter sp.]|uniref:Hsp70 family protein n=1 Tax=uncultured Desulfobacter sp. TaxID=240139 RepID=UPI002AA944D8|nr:Hsp70 family protein [uncultured Desulfobacter sp.]
MQIGIDFGTFYSSAAIMIGDTIKLVKDPVQHGYSFPSSIFVTENNDVLIGHAAENQRFKDLTRYRREFKRELGHNVPIVLGDKSFQVEDMVSEVLNRLKIEAELLTETPLKKAVITVPAMYAHYKKELMEKAGQRAGLEVSLLEEPIAAVNYYNWQSGQNTKPLDEEITLAFDFGGGTFDVALVKRNADHHKLLAMPTGLEYCGGLDFDRKIFEDLKSKCSDGLRNALEGQDSRAVKLRFMTAQWCREIKHQLSEVKDAEILIPIGEMESYRLSRDEFNGMIEPMVMEAIHLSSDLVKKAGLTWEGVDQILLVGGSCRVPLIHDLLASYTQRPILQVDDPEFAVCQGAALYGMKVKKTEPPPPISTPARKSDPVKSSDWTGCKQWWQTFGREIDPGESGSPAFINYDELAEFILKTLHNTELELYITPAIPPNKLTNASETCHVPDGETILGLIDCTFLGSAKKAIIFGGKAIYFHSHVNETIENDGDTIVQVNYSTDYVRYDRFPECIFKKIDTQLSLGGKMFNPEFNGELILDILVRIRRHIVEMNKAAPHEKDSLKNKSEQKQAVPSREKILQILKKNKDHNLFISPGIPPRKVTNASQSCGLPKDETILGIMDCTFFGSAANAMIFGEKGIYFHSDNVFYPINGENGDEQKYKSVTETGFRMYKDFKSETIILNEGQIEFSNTQRFNTDIADCDATFQILKDIQDEVNAKIEIIADLIACLKSRK